MSALAGLKAVLLATDFSEASAKPLRHALAIARHYHAKFYLVHVVSSLGFTIAGAQAKGMVSDAVERDARQLEQSLLASGALAGLKHEFIIREGDIWTELDGVIRQKNVDLVVVGTHGRGTLEKLLLGSVLSVRTSTVNKSIPTKTSRCERIKSFHETVCLRFGAGERPWRRRMLPTV